jgi:hypothetical protein
MKKHTTIKVNSVSDFQNMINEKDFNISRAIVDSILENIKTRKKSILILSVKCMEENQIIDITLEKHHFIETLKTNLPYFEKREMYEDCIKIKSGVKLLEQTTPHKV